MMPFDDQASDRCDRERLPNPFACRCREDRNSDDSGIEHRWALLVLQVWARNYRVNPRIGRQLPVRIHE